jgi:hypothetical protein
MFVRHFRKSCSANGGCPSSDAALVMDKSGNLYGTKQNGGGTGTVLHSFVGNEGVGKPLAGLGTDPATGKEYLYGMASGFDMLEGHGSAFNVSK